MIPGRFLTRAAAIFLGFGAIAPAALAQTPYNSATKQISIADCGTTCNFPPTSLEYIAPPNKTTTPAAPEYPIPIVVSGFPSTVQTVSITLHHLADGFSSLAETDLFGTGTVLMLVSPDGRAFSFAGFVCIGTADLPTGDYTFADSGSSSLMSFPACSGLSAGTYKPTWNFEPKSGVDFTIGGAVTTTPSGIPTSVLTNYNAPTGDYPSCTGCPTPQGTATFTSVFGGMSSTQANGTWYLYIIMQSEETTTSLVFGDGTNPAFTLTLTGSTLPGTTTTVTSSTNPATIVPPATSTQVTFTATVGSTSTPNNGTVTFTDASDPGNITSLSCASGNPANVNSSGVATCVATMSTQGARVIVGNYSGSSSFAPSSNASSPLVEVINVGTTHPQTNVYCNPGTIVLPELNIGSGTDPASAYPSIITVSGLSNMLISDITVQLNLDDRSPGGLSLMLVSPKNNKALEFWSYAGGGSGSNTARTMIIDDNATSGHPVLGGASIGSGTYPPTVNTNLGSTDAFCESSPCNSATIAQGAPATYSIAAPTGTASLIGTFGGGDPNDTWQLFPIVRNDGGTMTQWCLTFTLTSGTATQTTVQTSSITALTGSNVTLTAHVTSGGSPIGNTGTVTFLVDGLDISGGASVAVSGGQAVLTTGVLTEGTHNITARFNGTSSLGVSTSSNLVQRIDDATTPASTNSTSCGSNGTCTAQFCNTPGMGISGLVVPTPNQPDGAAAQYPSNIFVANAPGTVNQVNVLLNGFSTELADNSGTGTPDEFTSLITAPNGNNLDFFSHIGSTTSNPAVNLVFSDAGPSTLQFDPESGEFAIALANGTYFPASYGPGTNGAGPGNNVYPVCNLNIACGTRPTGLGPPAPSGPYTYAAPAGTGTLAGQFANSNPNGTWSYYIQNAVGGQYLQGAATIASWCLKFTENRPTVSVALPSSSTVEQGQQGVTFAVTIQNNTSPHPGPTGGTLTLSATFPSGFTPTGAGSGSDASWTCSTSGQSVSCTNATDVAPNANYPALLLGANVSPTATAGTNVTSFTASASGAGTLGSTGSNTSNITVIPAPVLTISKQHTGTFKQGQTATWTITIGNSAAGSTTAGTTTVLDTLPSGYTLSSFSGSAWSCSGSNAVTCTSSTLALTQGQTSVITLNVNVPVESPASVTNTASVYGGGDVNHTSSGSALSGSDSNVPVVQVPASFTVSGGGTQSAGVGTAFTNLQATVLDAGNVAIPGYSVVFTATPAGNGASGTFSNSTGTITIATNVSGIASAAFTANGIAGSYTVSAALSPAAGGLGALTFHLTNTDSPATITSLTSTTANGSYTVNASIPVQVSFSKAVTVTGTPTLALNSGGSASYTSGSGTTTLTFTYTVAAGQSTSGGHLDASSSIALSGAIQDASLTAATLTLPVGGATGSLASNKAIVIDTGAPTVVSYSVLFGTQSYNVIGSARTRLPWQITGIKVVFSKPIANGSAASLSGLSAAGFSGLGTTTLTWTIASTAQGSFATQLAGSGANMLTDAAGNALSGGSGFSQNFKVLWGDVNDDGIVNAVDLSQVAGAISTGYNVFADLNGDSVVNTADVTIARSRVGTTQP